MGYKIENTPLAEQDLDGILSYIAENLGDKTAAVSFLDEVDACYINLERMPFMYEQCRDPQLRALGYHQFPGSLLGVCNNEKRRKKRRARGSGQSTKTKEEMT